jgi:Mg2+ and Co2+ transporter CorA
MASPPLGPSSKSDTEDGRVRSIIYGEMTWTDILDPTPTEIAMLARDYHFHSLDLDGCLSAREPTKVEDHGDHLFITLRFADQVGQEVVVSR